MGGGKEEEKVMGPMFPRLHVNDADKGGPRAPPRNKMALYEQFSIPSQKLSSDSTSMMPRPLKDGGILIPSKSSEQGGGRESSMLTPFGNSSVPSHSAEKLHSNCSSEASMMSHHKQKFTKPIKYQSSNATMSLSLSAKCHSFQQHNFLNFRNPSKKFRSDDDFRVPRFSHSVVTRHCSGSNRHNKDGEKFPRLCTSSSLQLQTASEKHEEGIRFMNEQLGETSASIPSSSNKRSESLKQAHSPTNASLCREMHLGYDNLVDPVKAAAHAMSVARYSCSRPSVRDKYKSPNEFQNDEGGEDKECRSKAASGINIRDDVSDASMVYCISASDITPDDVVGVIGEKQFWKARRAIVNQQRVFTLQVFELHRLIKVQKLIAGSPHLLSENFSSRKVSQAKKIHSENVQEPSPLLVKLKDTSQKPDTSIECADENAVGTLPNPSANNNGCSKELINQLSSYGTYSGNPRLPSGNTSVKQSPWFFPTPPGNQWLVPVMSPSEGLVYKPYTGIGPPTAGFMAPVYGSCGPMSLTSGGGDFLKTGYSATTSHQHGIGILPRNSSLGQTYFPPYGMPVMNPSNSGSAVEQMNLARSQSNGHQSNMLSQMSRVSSNGVRKLQASIECDLQGSTASSPSERTTGDALPLFPVSPPHLESDESAKNHSREQQARVIKVVPHNPRSATESAARIFRTIQEERRQFD